MIGILVWAGIGIVLFHVWTPLWLKRRDPDWFALMHIMAAVLGPFAILLFLKGEDETDRRWNDEIRTRDRKDGKL
jgi:hypothetical protein